MNPELRIGWYGKLPSLGDFASRRLSPDFIEAWDGWLAAGLADWQRRDPDGWLADYLASPTRRFVLLPGVVPAPVAGLLHGTVPVPSPVAGVLMPSVDRVGRYFPLTIAFALPGVPRDAARCAELLGLLGALDDAAADALHDDWSADRLDAELAALSATAPPWLLDPNAAGTVSSPERPALRGGADAFLAQAVRDGLAGSPPRRAWWLATAGGGDGEDAATTLHDTAGLPLGADFAALWRGGGGHAPAAAADPLTSF